MPAAIIAAVALGACGSDNEASDTSIPALTAAVSTAARAGSSTTSSSGAATGSAAGRLDANRASAAEIQGALVSAGVPNAARWTDEVLEYRPYDADDVALTSLRKELEKYNPAPGVIDKIVSVLQP